MLDCERRAAQGEDATDSYGYEGDVFGECREELERIRMKSNSDLTTAVCAAQCQNISSIVLRSPLAQCEK